MKPNINIKEWNPEDKVFWEKTGKVIAERNLWLSIPALFLSFATWAMWGVIVKYMKDFGFNFGLTEGLQPNSEAYRYALTEVNNLYYTLPAIAGLSGATLRMTNSFLISLGGGRNVVFITTALMLLPTIGTGIALSDINTPYIVFAVMAFLSGFGGGNFASSMSNINGFFPKKMQGYALGMNAGIGNLGVGAMQKLIPLIVGFSLFGAVGTDAIINGIPFSGIQNAGWIWVPMLILSTLAAYFGMNNLATNCPSLPSVRVGVSKSLYMIGLGLFSTLIGVALLLGVQWENFGMEKISIWIVVFFIAFLTVQLMKRATPREIRNNLKLQFKILKLKHNWIMTVIYVMTFGSFIGFSFAFPKLCQDIFEYTDKSNPLFKNPNAPNYMLWAFIGPVLGAIARPLGGIISDRVNSGSKVTGMATMVQVFAVFAAAYFVVQAKESANPEEYWWPFFACFMILFVTTGIGNGSTFRSIPYIFNKEQTGPVLGWTSAIAAYGSFLIPNIFGREIKQGTPEYALYGFGVFYIICLLLNWWYYQGPKREFDNP